jgi:cell division septal protein FtsQ
VARDISAFIRQGDRRWDLKLKNGILVKMPESNSDFIGAWTILEVLLAVQGLAVDLGEIDLRIGGWAILKYRNGVKNEIDKFFGYKIIANNEGT